MIIAPKPHHVLPARFSRIIQDKNRNNHLEVFIDILAKSLPINQNF